MMNIFFTFVCMSSIEIRTTSSPMLGFSKWLYLQYACQEMLGSSVSLLFDSNLLTHRIGLALTVTNNCPHLKTNDSNNQLQFTKLAISRLIIVRFSKFKICDTQQSNTVLSGHNMTSREDVTRARGRHQRHHKPQSESGCRTRCYGHISETAR